MPRGAPGRHLQVRRPRARRPAPIDKADPFAFHAETPPKTGSVVWDLVYSWDDAEWMRDPRRRATRFRRPMSIYEVHLGSWLRVPEDGNRSLSYREIAPQLADYCEQMGFTHVEFLPIMEHPFYGSWGYQTTGYFAPTSRYGTPQDFMFLVDHLHQRGIGVILDWVPRTSPPTARPRATSTAPTSTSTPTPARASTRTGSSLIFNYGRHEVRTFLLSSALFWLDVYHVDGLRVDAVASMLYLDYSRKEGEWIPNEHGGRENLEAIALPAPLQRGDLPRAPRRADDRRGVDRLADGLAARSTSAGSASG